MGFTLRTADAATATSTSDTARPRLGAMNDRKLARPGTCARQPQAPAAAAAHVPPFQAPQAPPVEMVPNRRRAPLSSVPNGANSPLRAGGVMPALKRAHLATVQLDDVRALAFSKQQQYLMRNPALDEQENYATGGARAVTGSNADHRAVAAAGTVGVAATMKPGSYQLQDATSTQPVARKPSIAAAGGDAAEKAKLFTRPSNSGTPTAFERKLVASREQSKPATAARSNSLTTPVLSIPHSNNPTVRAKNTVQTIESLKTWQKHYKRAFPSFVFYFDSLPAEMRCRVTRQIVALGAKEEKFFSKSVTHVVTTRPIPPEIDPAVDYKGHAQDGAATSRHGPTHGVDPSTLTVNPSLLEKTRDGTTKFEMRSVNTDVLHRARQMHMKIWPWEKAQRVIATINDPGSAFLAANGLPRPTPASIYKRARESDLSLALRNEQLNASIDPQRELIPFKGPYIYVHCAFETYRPIMVKEYPKVSRKSQGSWPQFRSATAGKCPFIEDPMAMQQTARELERKNHLRAQQLEAEKRRLSKASNSGSKPKAAEKTGSKPSVDAGEVTQAPDRVSPQKRTITDGKSDDVVSTEHVENVPPHGKHAENGFNIAGSLPEALKGANESTTGRPRPALESLRTKLDAAAKALEESDESDETYETGREEPHVEDSSEHKSQRADGGYRLDDNEMQLNGHAANNDRNNHEVQLPPTGNLAMPQPRPLKRPAPDDARTDASRFLKPTSTHLLDRIATQNRSLGLQGLATAREPAASGMQPSNITSAIRSQMISSTTAGTGANAATSKEVHELKRKVLENNTGNAVAAPTLDPIDNEQLAYLKMKVEELKATTQRLKAIKDAEDARDALLRTQRRWPTVEEKKAKLDPYVPDRAKEKEAKPAPPKKIKRDLKPGYCENCRDKYEDFDTHILGRKHRKFAMNPNNWVELDQILEYIHSPGYQNMARHSVTSWDPSDDEDQY